MTDWVIIIPDEMHSFTKLVHTFADVNAAIRAAHQTAFTVSKHIPNPDEPSITCSFWSGEPHWVVKATLYGSDVQAVLFHMLWAWR